MVNKIFSSFILLLLTFLLIPNFSFAQRDLYEATDLNKVKYEAEDFGKMWTFDDIPVEKWEEKYGFKPDEKWLMDVQHSALQFKNGCSASFVSPNGLIMTNHHCGRGDLKHVQNSGENLLRDGFYAPTIDKERKIPNTFVDQLLLIEDVTKEIVDVINSTDNNDEKVKLRESKKAEIIKRYNEKTGLTCKVITLYNGGKFSLYGYKRYNDIRLVMAPDFQIASTGWDQDNFTYPRYELDFAFYRAYDEDGFPINSSKNYFKWSKKGAEEGEVIFITGRPGSTRRQYSVSQLEYLRDEFYPHVLKLLNERYIAYYKMFENHPERESELLNNVMSIGNGRKSYGGRLVALRDSYIMKKKKDFENDLRKRVAENSELNEKYGKIWDALKISTDKLRVIANEVFAFSNSNRRMVSEYFKLAKKAVEIANQKKIENDLRSEKFKEENIKEYILNLFPNNYDFELQKYLLEAQVNTLIDVLGDDHKLIQELFQNKRGIELVEYLLGESVITNKEKFIKFVNQDSDKILNSKDPFVRFIVKTENKFNELSKEQTELENTIEVLNQRLGEVIFSIYGDQIPPDATSSLRISDGQIKRYNYNGTIAPGKTTYFGLYDKYNSFGGSTYPYGLHPRWKTPAEGLNLSTPICFASTNDIVGGNSGSSVINKNKEIIGLVHDGNVESLAGDVIFLEENNRSIATDSYGLMEALKHVFKTEELVDELLTGKRLD